MSTAMYYLSAMVRHWRTTIKLIFSYEKHEWSEITADKLYERVKSSDPHLVIDVRSMEEFNSGYGHIPDAISVPILELKHRLDEFESYRDKEIFTTCPGGGLSLVAVELLTDAGFKDVKSLKGGTDLWHKKGYPTTTS